MVALPSCLALLARRVRSRRPYAVSVPEAPTPNHGEPVESPAARDVESAGRDFGDTKRRKGVREEAHMGLRRARKAATPRQPGRPRGVAY